MGRSGSLGDVDQQVVLFSFGMEIAVSVEACHYAAGEEFDIGDGVERGDVVIGEEVGGFGKGEWWVGYDFLFHGNLPDSSLRSRHTDLSHGLGGSGARGEKPSESRNSRPDIVCPRTAAVKDADVGFVFRFSHPAALLGGSKTLSLGHFPANSDTSSAAVGYVRFNPISKHPVSDSDIPYTR